MRPEGWDSPYARHFRLSPKVHDTVPMFIDVEDRFRFARIEPDFPCGRDKDVDTSDVGSIPKTSRENLFVHRRFQPLVGGVQAQLVRFPAPGNKSRLGHPDVGFPSEACHGLSVCTPIRVHAVDEFVRHRAHFEWVVSGFDPIGKEWAQLPVHQV